MNDWKRTALVTGATSGLGFEAAAQLAESGYERVIITGRTLEKAREAHRKLAARAGRDPFEVLALNLNDNTAVRAAVAELKTRGGVLDFVILNAGLVAGKEIARTADGMEITTAASVIGHHVLVTGLLNEGLLAKEARIVIAGSEAARGDVPMMGLVDIPEFAAVHHGGDRVRAIETIAQALEPYQYKHMPHYAMVKTFAALWAAALARRLPDGMTVNAVSPGSAPASNAMRNQTLLFRFVVGALAHTIGPLAGMAAPLSKAARRYLQAASFGADVNGRFFASPAGKMTGALVEQRQPHILDHENQEAAWEAIERLSGRASTENTNLKKAA